MESSSVCNHTGRESLMTSMITDRIWRREVLLPINQNYFKICDIFSFFKIKTQDFLIPRILASSEKNQVRVCNGVYCPITYRKGKLWKFVNVPPKLTP